MWKDVIKPTLIYSGIVCCFVLVMLLAHHLDQAESRSHYENGYFRGKQGLPAETCPFVINSCARKPWMNGWAEGYLEYQRFVRNSEK